MCSPLFIYISELPARAREQLCRARWTTARICARIIALAPVAQPDRVSDSDSEGHRFDSCRVYHNSCRVPRREFLLTRAGVLPFADASCSAAASPPHISRCFTAPRQKSRTAFVSPLILAVPSLRSLRLLPGVPRRRKATPSNARTQCGHCTPLPAAPLPLGKMRSFGLLLVPSELSHPSLIFPRRLRLAPLFPSKATLSNARTQCGHCAPLPASALRGTKMRTFAPLLVYAPAENHGFSPGDPDIAPRKKS